MWMGLFLKFSSSLGRNSDSPAMMVTVRNENAPEDGPTLKSIWATQGESLGFKEMREGS